MKLHYQLPAPAVPIDREGSSSGWATQQPAQLVTIAEAVRAPQIGEHIEHDLKVYVVESILWYSLDLTEALVILK
ncbi:hypothetical protein SEA_LILBEANIE_68 [Gordonia phage Lilbeanie]|uniref:Uncharacterized protein n=1 Tax=Gordonia phage Lilbeanie TaxID=2794947 RepID=A0A7T1KSB8_9CAUD|nr:hypothetical protein J1773_gp68 [Gordonia phage Lilbeanie]QPO17146.1 hypothetical protein SEA_LILBEANIE_68 [Gordonia phage Lilbeanie]